MGANCPVAKQIAKELLDLARQHNDAELNATANFSMGVTRLWIGEPLQARDFLMRSLACGTFTQHNTLLSQVGQNLSVVCHANLGAALWMLGYPEQAEAQAQESILLAKELAHPISIVVAFSMAALTWQYRREDQRVYDDAEAILTLASEQGFSLWHALAKTLRGWALAAQGQPQEGLVQIQQGLADLRATGTRIGMPRFLTLLAEGYSHTGQFALALDALNESKQVMTSTGQYYWQAEVYRYQGEILLKQAAQNAAEAERCFHQALDSARAQHAKSLELRGATSLAALWQQQGRKRQAHDLLAPVYSWFGEGFDTADLKDAKALLDELA